MIYVDISGIRQTNWTLPKTGFMAEAAGRQVLRLKRELPQNITDRYLIGERLLSAYRETKKLEVRIRELYNITNLCVEQYEQAEHRNERNARAFL